jgi:ubiquinone/menaquinone biosynthesis C-methylase UbiE
MKVRESGMPEEGMWAGFFQPDVILAKLGLSSECADAVEFGCGYGTFTVPAAKIVSGTVHAFDIDPEMIAETRRKIEAEALRNVRLYMRDFVADGTGLSDGCADYVMLFNILHAEHPAAMLREAYRLLRAGAAVAIVHWNYDPTTPRGPAMEIRPRPEQCRRWAEDAGFELLEPGIVDLPPYHYGMVLRRTG